MAAMFGADPNLQPLGDFTNFAAGTTLLQSRNLVPIPHCYIGHFVTGPLAPCQAWEIVGADIINHNDQVACVPLVNFVRLACTQNAAGETSSPLACLTLTVPLADAALLQHWTKLIARKLPGLNSMPILAAGQQVAQSLGELVAKQRQVCQDLVDRHVTSTLRPLKNTLVLACTPFSACTR